MIVTGSTIINGGLNLLRIEELTQSWTLPKISQFQIVNFSLISFNVRDKINIHKTNGILNYIFRIHTFSYVKIGLLKILLRLLVYLRPSCGLRMFVLTNAFVFINTFVCHHIYCLPTSYLNFFFCLYHLRSSTKWRFMFNKHHYLSFSFVNLGVIYERELW